MSEFELGENDGDLAAAEQLDPLELAEKVLSQTIKHDRATKLITFLAMLSAYSAEDQLNILMKGDTSIGKTHDVLQIAHLFPKEDLLKLAGASATAFFHEYGKYDKEAHEVIVELTRKILIFLDQPNDQLLERLKPLLSHDDFELKYKITDKMGKGRLRTKTVILRGWPAVIFCTAKLNVSEEQATRSFILTPGEEEEKIFKSIALISHRAINPYKYDGTISGSQYRQYLMKYIRDIRDNQCGRVVSFPTAGDLALKYTDNNTLSARSMRDFKRLISLTNAIALLKSPRRKTEGKIPTITATTEDGEQAWQLYQEISKPNQLGISPGNYNVYLRVIQPLLQKYETGVEVKTVQKTYREVYHKPLPKWKWHDQIEPALEAAGLILLEPDPTDRRRYLIIPGEISSSQGGGSIQTPLISPSNEILEKVSTMNGKQPPTPTTTISTKPKLNEVIEDALENGPRSREELQELAVAAGYSTEEFQKVFQKMYLKGQLFAEDLVHPKYRLTGAE